ncbi:MAG: hypothetical protein JSW39_25625 [Desulfobacterales bacterium]|nr:MAG: hypothetical protein JSW39_25625 [Desulfobacterales bacterium]
MKETLDLIRYRAQLLQNVTPEDVEDIDYVVQIGAEIEELIDELQRDYLD